MILPDGKDMEYLVKSFHIIYFICQFVIQMFMVWQRGFAGLPLRSAWQKRPNHASFVLAGKRVWQNAAIAHDNSNFVIVGSFCRIFARRTSQSVNIA